MEEPDNREDVIRRFWRDKSLTTSNRWTGQELLQFELGLLRQVSPRPNSVLDLGSGHGDLSRAYASSRCQLTAVDFEQHFGEAFRGKNHTFINESVTDFRSYERWEIILLMGVVTHLTEEEAAPLYRRIHDFLADDGKAIIKHQVGVREEVKFSGYSEALGSDYWARYPDFRKEQSLLESIFAVVDVLKYPRRFNPWPNTMHVAFICSIS